MSTQDVRAEAFLNIRCIVKGYHLSHFEVNVFVLSTIRFVITRLGIAAFFIILQQLMLLLWQFHCLQKYNFCYQNFSVKARCNHFPFFEVKRLAHGTNF